MIVELEPVLKLSALRVLFLYTYKVVRAYLLNRFRDSYCL